MRLRPDTYGSFFARLASSLRSAVRASATPPPETEASYDFHFSAPPMLPMISISVRDERRLAELRVGRVGIALLAALLGFALCAGRVAAQQPSSAGAGVAIRMSLDEALRMAQLQSQTIQIARSGVARAT